MTRDSAAPAKVHDGRHRRPWRRPWVRRALTAAFILVVLALVVSRARDIDWSDVFATLRGYRAGTLWIGMLIAATSGVVYCCYDLLGRAVLQHGVPKLRTGAIAFVSYAINLNLGSLIGGVGMRYRLYSKAGLSARQIGRVLALSLTTNWLGFIALAGLIWGLRLMPVPSVIPLGTDGLQVVGLGLLVPVGWYLFRCASHRHRTLRVRGIL